jgi:2-oxoisovalerate dehydrogenase E1 component alpha subunit
VTTPREWAQPVAPHRDAGLEDEQIVQVYRLMLRVRALDERMWILTRQGKASFVLTSRGHEAAQIASALALRPGHDFVFTYYRSLAAALTLGVTPAEMMLSTLGRADDPFSGGRQLPNHFSVPRLRIPTVSSSVATQIPHAVGAAYAARVLGEDWVSLAYFGDGATSKGDFHEALTFAAVWKLPAIFFCENNGWAISVPLDRQMAAPPNQHAVGYGMPGVVVDGVDPAAVYAATRRAVDRARAGEGPSLIEARVERLVPHSSQDDDHYRDPAALERLHARDPLSLLRAYLLERGLLDAPADADLQSTAHREALDAQELAEAAPLPRAADARRHLLKEDA